MAFKKRWVYGIGLVLASAVVLSLFQGQIASIVLEQVVRRNVGRDIVPQLTDGLHLALCGTGSPFPDPARAGPCSVVIAGGQVLMVDAGEGSARNLGYMGIPAAKIDAILLTHLHSDHIDGLGPIMLQRWGLGTHTSPLPVYGPTGVEKVVEGLRTTYALDSDYRVAHHSEKIMPPGGSGGKAYPFAFEGTKANQQGANEQVVVLDKQGLKVTAFLVDHAPIHPAVGYRFDYKGRSLVISGDTKKTASMVAVSKGADLLVHEALQPAMVELLEKTFADKSLPNTAQIMRDILNYHTSPEQAAEQAQLAGTGMLILNHIVPPLPTRFFYPAFLGEAKKHYSGDIVIGEDGMLFSLPSGNKEIQRSQLK